MVEIRPGKPPLNSTPQSKFWSHQRLVRLISLHFMACVRQHWYVKARVHYYNPRKREKGRPPLQSSKKWLWAKVTATFTEFHVRSELSQLIYPTLSLSKGSAFVFMRFTFQPGELSKYLTTVTKTNWGKSHTWLQTNHYVFSRQRLECSRMVNVCFSLVVYELMYQTQQKQNNFLRFLLDNMFLKQITSQRDRKIEFLFNFCVQNVCKRFSWLNPARPDTRERARLHAHSVGHLKRMISCVASRMSWLKSNWMYFLQ